MKGITSFYRAGTAGGTDPACPTSKPPAVQPGLQNTCTKQVGFQKKKKNKNNCRLLLRLHQHSFKDFLQYLTAISAVRVRWQHFFFSFFLFSLLQNIIRIRKTKDSQQCPWFSNAKYENVTSNIEMGVTLT